MIIKKIESLLSKLDEIEASLAKEDIILDQKAYRALTQEHSFLMEIKTNYDRLKDVEKELEGSQSLLKTEKDPDLIQMAQDEIISLSAEREKILQKLENLIIPPAPHDHGNTIIELRAGTGGDEAGLFVGDCIRMYQMYAAKMGWKWEALSCTPSDLGGFKEYVMVLSGRNVYRYLQYEAGTHRVQRVPETEAQGRVHTSTITVAAFLEPEEDEDVNINEADLRIETTKSSGAGGQHVNKTDSAVRITHLPTGIVIFCQQERSQQKNRNLAFRLLRAQIADMERKKKKEAIDSTRAQQVGSGDRSEKIRTYNFPQNRLTDHRIDLTKHCLDRIMDGELEEVSQRLVAYFQQKQLETI